jgi:regulator of protease activity HflC (stomatin/prohibitin superfamily)
MVHSILGYLVAIGWALWSLSAGFSFMRTWYRYTLKRAIALLLSVRFMLPLLFIVVLTGVNASLVFVYPQHMAVVVSLAKPAGMREKPILSGLHWIVPMVEKPIIYPVFWQTYTMTRTPFEGQHPHSDPITARTLDSQEVKMDISIIYRLDPEYIVDLHRFWQDRYTEELMRPAVRALVRRQVSQYTVDEVNSDKRNELAELLDTDLKRIGAENGIIVKRVLLRNIAFTKEYATSVERKQVALQGEMQKQHEAKQIENLAKGKARRIELVARAEADAIKIKAQAKAEARLIQAQAEAQALQLVANALQDRQNLLTYRYIEHLSPNVQAVVLPHDMPLIFPLPDMQPPERTVPLPLNDRPLEMRQD